MLEKVFKYKGQMINYYNKIRMNPKVKICYCGFFLDTGGWAVRYSYK